MYFSSHSETPCGAVHPLNEQPCAAARSPPPPPPSPPPYGVVHRAGIETRRNARRSDRTDSRESIGDPRRRRRRPLSPAAAITTAVCPRASTRVHRAKHREFRLVGRDRRMVRKIRKNRARAREKRERVSLAPVSSRRRRFAGSRSNGPDYLEICEKECENFPVGK